MEAPSPEVRSPIAPDRPPRPERAERLSRPGTGGPGNGLPRTNVQIAPPNIRARSFISQRASSGNSVGSEDNSIDGESGLKSTHQRPNNAKDSPRGSGGSRNGATATRKESRPIPRANTRGNLNALSSTSKATVRDEDNHRKKKWVLRRKPASLEGTRTHAVEIWGANHKPRVLFSPVPERLGENTETLAVACNAEDRYVVRQGEAFHITVEGFYITPNDFWLAAEQKTELLMYSVEFNGNEIALVKNMYDYRSSENRNGDGSTAFAFTSVPNPANLLMSSDGAESGKKPLSHLDVHLRLAEVTDTIRSRRLVQEVTKLNEQIVPQMGIDDKDTLTDILSCVGSLSQGVIDEITLPDTSFNADLAFKIAPKDLTQPAELDTYLRYGVYYFLRRPSRAKLYAQVSTMQNARLMVKMADEPGVNPSRKQEYAEFAETAWISFRVRRGPDQAMQHSGAPQKVVSLDSLYSRVGYSRFGAQEEGTSVSGY